MFYAYKFHVLHCSPRQRNPSGTAAAQDLMSGSFCFVASFVCRKFCCKYWYFPCSSCKHFRISWNTESSIRFPNQRICPKAYKRRQNMD